MSEFEELISKLLEKVPELSRSVIEERINEKKEKVGAGYLTDQGAIIQVIRWANAFEGGEPSEVITQDLGDVRFLDDLEAFTIARAPRGAVIPIPDRADILEGVTGQSREVITRPNTSDIPGPQDFGAESE